MLQSEVMTGIQKVFDEIFLEDVVVTRELTAYDVAEWDSILQVSLILAIEEEFRIRFRVGEVEGTKNVGELADIIVKRLEAK